MPKINPIIKEFSAPYKREIAKILNVIKKYDRIAIFRHTAPDPSRRRPCTPVRCRTAAIPRRPRRAGAPAGRERSAGLPVSRPDSVPAVC